MSKTILSAGSIKVVLENSKIADRIFKKKDQNDCAKSAMLETVVFWSRAFLPQRFDAANVKYNAHVSRQWDELKKRMLARGHGTKDGRMPVAPQPQDLVFTGAMRKSVIKGARPSAVSTNVQPKGRVAMPTAHAIKPNISRVLKFVPIFEHNRLCEVFKNAFNKAIVAGEARQVATAKAKADLRESKRAARKAATLAKRAATAPARAARKQQRARERIAASRAGIAGTPSRSRRSLKG